MSKDRMASIEMIINRPIQDKSEKSPDRLGESKEQSEPKITRSRKTIVPQRVQPKRQATVSLNEPESKNDEEQLVEEEPKDIFLSNTQDQLQKNKNFSKQNRNPPKRRSTRKAVNSEEVIGEVVESTRKKRENTRCPHKDAKHYAKGMCNHCYHLYGRSSLATKCEHKDRMVYAKGQCQNCYFLSYNTKKKEQELKAAKRKSKKKST